MSLSKLVEQAGASQADSAVYIRPLFAHFDVSEVHTDVSDHGMGAILALKQRGDEVISYVSHLLSAGERNSFITEF